MDFITLITKNFSEETLQSVAKAAGIDAPTATKAFGVIAPMIMSKMSENASSGGVDALNNALDAHDGSIFSNLGDLANTFGDGEKILGHVFGTATADATTQVAAQTGIDSAQVQKVMALLAPLILGALGKAKKEGGMDASSLTETLGGLATLFGSNKNLAEAVGALMGGKNTQGGMGDMLSMLGGLFGKK